MLPVSQSSGAVIIPSPQNSITQFDEHPSPETVFPSSHPSPDSRTPFPHTGGQLLSFKELHPLGQHPSLLMHEVIGGLVHVPGAVHISVVQALPSLHIL